MAVGFLVAELLSMSTVCLYIGAGALAAMVCALLGGEWIGTILTFVIATIVLYLTTYGWRKRLIASLHRTSEDIATGMDALVGRTGTVISSGDSLRMRIDGDVWQVRPASGNYALRAGQKVKVDGYDSIIVIVTPVRES